MWSRRHLPANIALEFERPEATECTVYCDHDFANVVVSCSGFGFVSLCVLALENLGKNSNEQIPFHRVVLGSPFAAPFQKDIDSWEERLLLTQNVMDEWLKV